MLIELLRRRRYRRRPIRHSDGVAPSIALFAQLRRGAASSRRGEYR
jgi:hypothetical protein